MEKLSRYLAKHKIKPTAFAAKLGVRPSTITRPLRGERPCSFKLAMLIEQGTGGEVKAAVLLAARMSTEGRAA